MPLIDLQPGFIQLDTDTRSVQIASPNEMTVLFTLEAKVGNTEGLINFCIPYSTIKPIMRTLSNEEIVDAVDIKTMELYFESVKQDALTQKFAFEKSKTTEQHSEANINNDIQDKNCEHTKEIIGNAFEFNDIVKLSNRSIQKVIREVDSQELAMALKGADVTVRDKIFCNLSKRAAFMIKDDMDYMGSIKIKYVDESRQKIISIINYLNDFGEIEINRT